MRYSFITKAARVWVCFLLLISLSATAQQGKVDELLGMVGSNLLVDLEKTAGYLKTLEGLSDVMNKPQRHRYLLLKASYLGMVGKHRQRIALVRKTLPEVSDIDEQVKFLYELSDGYTRLGEYEEALKAMNRGVRLLPKLTDINAKVSMLQGAITLLISMDAQEEAMDYADRMYRLGIGSNNADYICIGLANKLDIQYQQRHGDSARAMLKRTLQLCNDSNYRFISDILRASDAIYLIDSGQYREGVVQAAEVLKAFLANNPQADQVNLLEAALARGHFHLGEYDTAQQYGLKVYNQAKASESSLMLKKVSLTLARIKRAQGDLDAALSFYETYVAQQRLLEKDKFAKNIAYQRVKYDNLDKTNQLELLKVKNSSLLLTQKLQSRNNENLVLVVSLGAILLLFLTILLVLSFRKKHALIYEPGLDEMAKEQVNLAQLSQQAMFDAHRKDAHFCVILFELDCLADYDTLVAEDFAETLVEKTIHICHEQLRLSDYFGKVAENRFVICLLEADTRGAAALAERCRLAIAAIDVSDELDKPLTSSFGVAMIDEGFVDYNEALIAAEKALQEAKERGGDQVWVYTVQAATDDI